MLVGMVSNSLVTRSRCMQSWAVSTLQTLNLSLFLHLSRTSRRLVRRSFLRDTVPGGGRSLRSRRRCGGDDWCRVSSGVSSSCDATGRDDEGGERGRRGEERRGEEDECCAIQVVQCTECRVQVSQALYRSCPLFADCQPRTVSPNALLCQKLPEQLHEHRHRSHNHDQLMDLLHDVRRSSERP